MNDDVIFVWFGVLLLLLLSNFPQYLGVSASVSCGLNYSICVCVFLKEHPAVFTQ